MIGERLKVLREEKQIGQKQLAGILEVSTSAIGMYENNLREPDDVTKIKIAQYFDCTIDYLLGLSDIKGAISPLINISNLSNYEINDVKLFINFLEYKRKKQDNKSI